MKRFYLLLFLATLVVSSSAYGQYPTNSYDSCGAYAQKFEHESNKLNNFEDEVVAPMAKEMQRLKRTIDYRIKRPQEIEKKISGLENEIRKLETEIKANDKKIELLTREAEALDTQKKQVAAGKKRRKIGELERKNINKTSKIERDSGKIDDFREEAQEIITARPPLPRLEDELARLEMELADQEQIKRQLIENVRFYESALGMCRDYQQLRMECGRN